MRKILILISLLLMVVIPSAAREKEGAVKACPYKYEVNLAWGYVPDVTHNETGNYMMACLQPVPIGVTVGKKVYGLFELGLGSEYK